MLSLQNLSAVLSSGFRLAGVSFTVDENERLAVLGPNGSGKSFLLRLILGLETPRSGSISRDDQVLSESGRVVVTPEARGMGVVFQEGALFPHLDVRGNVSLALPKKTSASARAEKVDRALELTRIRHLDKRSVQSLSGGEQQRVAIARALVHHPRILLLDEPFHSLDGPLKREILADVRTLVEKEQIATILVTHDTDEAASFADRVVLLRAGRVVQDGTFDELYTSPSDREAADFLGPVESIEASLARASSIGLPNENESATLFFRREHLELSALSDGEPEGLEVTSVQARGALQDISVKLPDGSELVSRSLAAAPWLVGQKVSARIAQTLSWLASEEQKA